MWGTCLGGLLYDIEFYVGVTPVVNDWPFDGDGGYFFCSVVCVP